MNTICEKLESLGELHTYSVVPMKRLHLKGPTKRRASLRTAMPFEYDDLVHTFETSASYYSLAATLIVETDNTLGSRDEIPKVTEVSVCQI